MADYSSGQNALRTASFWGLTAIAAAFVLFALAGWWAVPVGSFIVPVSACAAGAAASGYLPQLWRRLDMTASWKLLAVTIAVAAVTRTVLLLLTRTDPIMDFARMYRAAASLASGAPIEQARYISMFPHTLGYPAFLSALFRVTGAAVWAAQGFNLALSMVCCALIFFIVRKSAGNGGAFAASLVWAILPSQIFQTALVGNEIMHLSLILAAVRIYLAAADRTRSLRAALGLWAGLGAVVGVSSSVRPVGPVLLVAFALCFFVFSDSPFKKTVTRMRLEKFIPVALMTLTYFLAAGAFTLWADGALGRETPGAAAGWNLYVGMNAEAHGAWNPGDQALMDEMMQTDMSAKEIQGEFLRKGMERLTQNLRSGSMLSLAADKFVRVWSHDYVVAEWLAQSASPGSAVNIGRPPLFGGAVAACDAGWFFLMGLTGVGLVRAARGHVTAVCLPVTILTGLIIAFIILEANPRYHFPADALLCLIFPAFSANTLCKGARHA